MLENRVTTPTEIRRARQWRESLNLSTTQLGAHIGLSRLAIDYYEKGHMPPKAGQVSPIPDIIWHRYRRLCGDLDAQVRGRRKGEVFRWGER